MSDHWCGCTECEGYDDYPLGEDEGLASEPLLRNGAIIDTEEPEW